MESRIFTNNLRNLVTGTETRIPLSDGRFVTAINFDNAATTPPFVSVMQEIMNFAPWYSSVHRGTGYKSRISSEVYEKSRQSVLNFVNADPENCTAIFVKNATEAINKLSYRLCENNKKCVVLSTGMEHHSNDLPWRGKFKVDYIDVDAEGKLIMEDLEYKLRKYGGNVKFVTVTGASNVTGYINPVYEAAAVAHKYNAGICVDGAQLIPHMPFDMRPFNNKEHIDYLAFSAHKMYAPFGIGVLIGPKEAFTKGEPDYVGGGTVKIVTHDIVKWDSPPHKEEAGSPNIMGVVALNTAINSLGAIGMRNIHSLEKRLTEYALDKFRNIPQVILYGDKYGDRNRLGIIPFNIEGIHHSLVAEILSGEAGIAIRNGCFCAQPYIQKLLKIDPRDIEKFVKNPDMPRPGMVRISFGLYNDFREIDILADMVRTISENKEYYIKKYEMFM